MEKAKDAERGSAKLFLLERHDHDGLARALGLARGEYEVKWWWKYGTPAFDHVHAEIEVDAAHLGGTVSKLMQLNGSALQVTAECFPYGITDPGFLVKVKLNKGESSAAG